MEPRAARLRAYLHALARTPFAWGQDCLTGTVGGWIRAERGVDPAATWRGRYASEAEALALIAAAGGLEALVDRELAAVGIGRARFAELGDVGLVRAVTRRGPDLIGAIFTGERWAATTARGLTAGPGPAVAVWRI